MVRDKSKLSEVNSDKVTIFEGTPEKKRRRVRAMKGTGAVIIALNQVRKSDNPFSKVIGNPHFLSTAMQNVVDSMKKLGLERVIGKEMIQNR